MKKILTLAYDFPPYNSIGAQRPASWLKYLKQFDWYPVVVTRHWDKEIQNSIDYIKPSVAQKIAIEENEKGTIIRVPFKPNLRDKWLLRFGMDRFILGRKILTLLYQLIKFLIPASDPTYGIYKAAVSYLKKNRVDYILATGEPFILFKLAAKLSAQHKIPWIADYRDAWTNNPSLANTGKFDRFSNQHFFRYFEKNIIKSSLLITTAAPSYKKSIQQLHHNQQVEVVLNGFDAKKTSITKKEENRTVFTLVYAGIIYPHQKVETFLAGIRSFIGNNHKVKVIFYGLKFYPEMVERIIHFDPQLAAYFEFTERIPYEQIAPKLKASHLLLLFSVKGMDWLNAKIFDYLQANRKVLLVENDYGILEEIINECQAGVTADTPEQVAALLEKYYQEWLTTGDVAHQTINYEKYSREKQAEKLAELLNKYIQ